MESQEIEHFIHAPGGKPRVAVAAAEDTLRDVLIRLEVIRDEPDGRHIFVGECVEALNEADEIDNGADEQTPVDIGLTLAVLEIQADRQMRQREQAGKEQVRVAVLRIAEGAEHLAEHEEQEERLQDHLGEEDVELAPGHVGIALENSEEDASLAGDGIRRSAHRSALPVRSMKTSSSVGMPSFTSVRDRPRPASAAAAGATSKGASPET